MAVCRWIYANAKMDNDRKDYFVRLCDSQLEVWKGKLIELSNRLLSADKRRGKAEKQVCWFAGFISRDVYLVAAGGGQEELLGISSGRYREQHCVLGYGFTGEDICLMKKEDEMFEPLKEIMREIQHTGEERKIETAENRKLDLSAYRIDNAAVSYDSGKAGEAGSEYPKGSVKTGKDNDACMNDSSSKNGKRDVYAIFQSTERTDSRVWKYSLSRPVMLGIISIEDGKRLLREFPDGIVTVIEDTCQRIYVPQERSGHVKNEDAAGSVKRSGNEDAVAGVRTKENCAKRQINESTRIKSEKGQKKQEQRQQEQKNREQKYQEQKYREQKQQEQKKQEQKYQEQKYREQRQQELRRQKRREQMKLVKYWALWCRSQLSDTQVTAVKNTIERMKKEEKWNGKENGFFRQSEYAAYMLLWHDKRKRNKMQEIHFLIESWADTMNVKKTIQLAELIEHINEIKRDSRG